MFRTLKKIRFRTISSKKIVNPNYWIPLRPMHPTKLEILQDIFKYGQKNGRNIWRNIPNNYGVSYNYFKKIMQRLKASGHLKKVDPSKKRNNSYKLSNRAVRILREVGPEKIKEDYKKWIILTERFRNAKLTEDEEYMLRTRRFKELGE